MTSNPRKFHTIFEHKSYHDSHALRHDIKRGLLSKNNFHHVSFYPTAFTSDSPWMSSPNYDLDTSQSLENDTYIAPKHKFILKYPLNSLTLTINQDHDDTNDEKSKSLSNEILNSLAHITSSSPKHLHVSLKGTKDEIQTLMNLLKKWKRIKELDLAVTVLSIGKKAFDLQSFYQDLGKLVQLCGIALQIESENINGKKFERAFIQPEVANFTQFLAHMQSVQDMRLKFNGSIQPFQHQFIDVFKQMNHSNLRNLCLSVEKHRFNKVYDKLFANLAGFLADKGSKLEELQLFFTNLVVDDPSKVSILFESFQKLEKLNSISLRFTRNQDEAESPPGKATALLINEDALKALGKSLGNIHQLESINISIDGQTGNFPSGYKHLSCGIGSLKLLRSLKISLQNCGIKSSGYRNLVNSFTSLVKLQYLELIFKEQDREVNETAGFAIAKVVQKLVDLKSFQLDFKELTDEGLMLMAASLMKMGSLTKLDLNLSFSPISSYGFANFIEHLQFLSNLEQLQLAFRSCVKIEDKAIIKLSNVLPQMNRLEFLSLDFSHRRKWNPLKDVVDNGDQLTPELSKVREQISNLKLCWIYNEPEYQRVQ